MGVLLRKHDLRPGQLANREHLIVDLLLCRFAAERALDVVHFGGDEILTEQTHGGLLQARSVDGQFSDGDSRYLGRLHRAPAGFCGRASLTFSNWPLNSLPSSAAIAARPSASF